MILFFYYYCYYIFYIKIKSDDEIIKNLEWMGLFSDEVVPGIIKCYYKYNFFLF